MPNEDAGSSLGVRSLSGKSVSSEPPTAVNNSVRRPIALVKELAKHFDVIAVDMRGNGDSDKPGYDPKTDRIQLDPVDHYDLNTTVDDHMRVAKALGIDKAYWLGHDWASLTMHKFVQRYPEMVKKLVLSRQPESGGARVGATRL